MEDKKVELTKEQIIGNQKKELQQLAAENCFLGNQARSEERRVGKECR